MTNTKTYSKKRSNLKKVICILSSFFLSVTLTIITLFLSLKIGFISDTQVLAAFTDSAYYNNVYNHMISDCKNEALASNLSESIFDGVFSLDDMTSHCSMYTVSLINGKTYTPDTSTIESTLSENIRQYVEANQLEVDGEINDVITDFTASVISYYKSAIEFPYFDQIATIFNLFNKLILYIIPFIGFLSLVLIYILYKLNSYKKNRSYRYLAYSFLSCALSLLVIPIFSYVTKFYNKLLFSPEYVYNFITTYYENGMKTFLYAGIGALILGILCIIISARIKSTLIKNSGKEN